MGELYDWPRCHLGANEATLTNADKYDLNQTKTESKSTTKLTITESCVYFFKYTVWDSKAVGNRLYPEIKMSILQHECGISILNTLEIPQSCIKSYITETKTRCGPLLLLGVYKNTWKGMPLDVIAWTTTLVSQALTWWRHQMETFFALLALCEGIHRLPVDSPHKGQWQETLMFSLICPWTNSWSKNRDAGDLRRHRAHYDVTLMYAQFL